MNNNQLHDVKLRHVGIVVKDLEKSLNFWCDVLGFCLEKKQNEKGEYLNLMMGLKNVDLITAKLSDPSGNLIELLHFKNYNENHEIVRYPYSIGLTHIALTVPNIDMILDKLNKSKIIKQNTVVISPDKKVKVVYIRAIEDLLIKLVEEL